MSSDNPDRERLELAEHDAHARFVRLQGFGDRRVVQSARTIWQECAAALEAHFRQTHP